MQDLLEFTQRKKEKCIEKINIQKAFYAKNIKCKGSQKKIIDYRFKTSMRKYDNNIQHIILRFTFSKHPHQKKLTETTANCCALKSASRNLSMLRENRFNIIKVHDQKDPHKQRRLLKDKRDIPIYIKK